MLLGFLELDRKFEQVHQLHRQLVNYKSVLIVVTKLQQEQQLKLFILTASGKAGPVIFNSGKRNDSFHENITWDYSFKGSLSEFSSHSNKILDTLFILDSVFFSL